MAAWAVATRLADKWERFPHLAITSPQMRCGKTTLLELIQRVTPNSVRCDGMTSATAYRLIGNGKNLPTLLLDEAQCLTRTGSEQLQEIFCGSVGRDSVVLRCAGDDHEPVRFSTYCPKVIARIGDLNPVLADRCFVVEVQRKTRDEEVERARPRKTGPEADALVGKIETFLKSRSSKIIEQYESLEEWDIGNDRMADLLLPLQAVLTVDSPGLLGSLKEFAINTVSREKSRLTSDVLLLKAIREIFASANDPTFFKSTDLASQLNTNHEAEVPDWADGREVLTTTRLAYLLKSFRIEPRRTQVRNPKTGGDDFGTGFPADGL